MKLSREATTALIATGISIVVGGLIAKYGGDISDAVSENQPSSGETSGISSCPPGSINVESTGETALGPDIGLSQSGVICMFNGR